MYFCLELFNGKVRYGLSLSQEKCRERWTEDICMHHFKCYLQKLARKLLLNSSSVRCFGLDLVWGNVLGNSLRLKCFEIEFLSDIPI